MEKLSESMISLHNLVEAARPSSLVFGSPQLAALHSMTEKAPTLSYPHPAFVPVSMQNGTFKPVAIPASLAASCSAAPGSTPHGINDILSRPDGQQAAAVATAALANHGLLNRFAGYAGPAGLYFHRMGKPLADFGSAGQAAAAAAAALYWPANLLHSPVWRDTHLTCPPVSSSSQSTHCSRETPTDKDGKKKHTRPTFSGQQIFALEKTFEQTKYLAGPERARLAYALGMSESQVKVWFQNRRTKWRKKHAAEMAAAKRKHDSTHHTPSTTTDHYALAHHSLLAAGAASAAVAAMERGSSDHHHHQRDLEGETSRSERSFDGSRDGIDDEDDEVEIDEVIDADDDDAELNNKRRKLDIQSVDSIMR